MTDSKPIVVAHWITRLIAVGILAMGAVPKFTGGAGMLAEKLPGGTAATLAIGVVEVVAVVLMLVPKTALVGSGLAAVVMLGAIGSHVVVPVGMEGELGSMLPLAIVAFVGAAAATAIGWRRARSGGATDVGAPAARPHETPAAASS